MLISLNTHFMSTTKKNGTKYVKIYVINSYSTGINE